MNYARHTQTGATVFFQLDPPLEQPEFCKWAFWNVPHGWPLSRFHGKLIGETSDARAIRLGLEKKK